MLLGPRAIPVRKDRPELLVPPELRARPAPRAKLAALGRKVLRVLLGYRVKLARRVRREQPGPRVKLDSKASWVLRVQPELLATQVRREKLAQPAKLGLRVKPGLRVKLVRKGKPGRREILVRLVLRVKPALPELRLPAQQVTRERASHGGANGTPAPATTLTR